MAVVVTKVAQPLHKKPQEGPWPVGFALYPGKQTFQRTFTNPFSFDLPNSLVR